MKPARISCRLPHLTSISPFAGLIGVVARASAGDVDALYQVAGEGNPEHVNALLNSGVKVNERTSNGGYALSNAAKENQAEVMSILLARGDDPNVQNSLERRRPWGKGARLNFC